MSSFSTARTWWTYSILTVLHSRQMSQPVDFASAAQDSSEAFSTVPPMLCCKARLPKFPDFVSTVLSVRDCLNDRVRCSYLSPVVQRM